MDRKQPAPIRDPKDLGALIQARRKGLGLSQETLATITGIPQPNLSKIERGQTEATLGTYLRLLASLGIDLQAKARP